MSSSPTTPADATTDLLLGTRVHCHDGPAGTLVRVVVEPDSSTVTHVVVDPRHGRLPGHLVPVDLVRAGRAGATELDCTLADLVVQPSSERASLLAAQPPDDPLLAWPFYGIGGGATGMGSGLDVQVLETGPAVRHEDRLPDGERQVQRHEEALGRDGVVGRVRGLRMTADGHLVTQVLLGVGHPWNERRVAVPFDAVTGMREVLSLDLSVAEVDALATDGADASPEGAAGPRAELLADVAAVAAATDLAAHLAAGQVGRDDEEQLLHTVRTRHEVPDLPAVRHPTS